jgi:hypothetical protein
MQMAQSVVTWLVQSYWQPYLLCWLSPTYYLSAVGPVTSEGLQVCSEALQALRAVSMIAGIPFRREVIPRHLINWRSLAIQRLSLFTLGHMHRLHYL